MKTNIIDTLLLWKGYVIIGEVVLEDKQYKYFTTMEGPCDHWRNSA